MKMKNRFICIYTIIIFITLIFFGVYIGSYGIGLKNLFDLILKLKQTDLVAYKIIWNLRIPRVLMALLVGMLLGSSGVLIQSLFKNPIADPYTIGISSSATFGAVIAYTLGLSDIYYGVFASFSSLAISLFILTIFGKKEQLDISTILIIGIAFSSFFRALISLFIYLNGEDSYRIILWTMGYLGNASWNKVLILLLPLSISLIYFYINRYRLDLILLSDEEAHSLGVDIRKFKRDLLLVSTIIIGFSVAFTGLIGFIGVIIPHIVRKLFGCSNVQILPFSMLYGGGFLLFCDIISRSYILAFELPIGVVTAFFGAPFFIYLALKNKRGI